MSDEQFSAGDSGSGATAVAEGSSPLASASPESASAGTITEPGATAAATPGPVPYDRFNDVNTRYNDLRWAEQYDPRRVQQHWQFFQWLDSDPEGAYRYLGDYLGREGRLRPSQPQQSAEARPQPDVVIPETGQKFYSADAAEKLAEWMARQQVTPLEQRLKSLETNDLQRHSQATAQSILAEAMTWPHFKEHQREILTEMERDGRLSVEGAYNRVVLPKLRQLERAAVLKEIQAKSRASTVSPGHVTATQSKPTQRESWTSLFRREMAKRGTI